MNFQLNADELEARMDARPARVMSVTRIQRATLSTGYLKLRIMNEEPPPRGVLSLCNFLF